MSYMGSAWIINNRLNGNNKILEGVKGIDFSGWNGSASNNLLTSLSENIEKINTLNSNLQFFSNILSMVEQLMDIDNRIVQLSSQLSGLDEKKDGNLIASIQAEISKLKVERKNLKNEIIRMVDSLIAAVNANIIVDTVVVSYADDLSTDSLRKEVMQIKANNSKININKVDSSEENLTVDESNNSSTVGSNNNKWTGEKLTAKMGILWNGPSGSETFCPDQPVGAIKIMMDRHGYSDLELYYRDDGVTLVRGVDPNGKKFEDLIAVAADLYDEPSHNLEGMFKRGDIVETSLGTAMVVDMCGRAQNMRRANGAVHFDIYTAWHDENERWYHEIYGK